MVDRVGRDRLAAAIRSYMDEQSTAFQLDEVVSDLPRKDDQTLEDLAMSVWGLYDDVVDHPVIASKQEWDFLNRVLLLLESDGELVTQVVERWHIGQALAGAALAFCLLLAAYFRFGWQVLPLNCAFGIISILLSAFNRRHLVTVQEVAITPFPSIGDIVRVRRRLPRFVRRKYPAAVAQRTSDHSGHQLMYIPWLLFSPLALLFQIMKRTTGVPYVYPSQRSSPNR